MVVILVVLLLWRRRIWTAVFLALAEAILWYLFTPALRREQRIPLLSRPSHTGSSEPPDARPATT